MNESRRTFLVKLGSAVLFGVGSAATLGNFLARTVLADLGSGGAAGTAGAAGTESQPVRWGMFVDMSKCAEDCTDCIDACHSKHNVPDFDNPKDEIKWIKKASFEKTFPSKNHQFTSTQVNSKPVLTFCNHCAEPPCVKVCPTKATFQRKDGIVEMDFHRCIGCRFCMAGCPYGSRSFNWRNPREAIAKLDYGYPTREIGVVEKCNFCSERLAKGKQPACVVTCPNEVLTFGNLHDPDSGIRQKLKTRVTFQRKPELGTKPSVFYAFEGGND